MSIPGYVDYQKREFCKDIECPIQMDLNSLNERTTEYEKIRQTCKTACRFTTWQFHHWLIEKGYLIVKPDKNNVTKASSQHRNGA